MNLKWLKKSLVSIGAFCHFHINLRTKSRLWFEMKFICGYSSLLTEQKHISENPKCLWIVDIKRLKN